MTEKDTETVRNWPMPRNCKDVERFRGLANYHIMFVKDFAEIACPLYKLTGGKPFIWGEEQQGAFEKLKAVLTSPPVLALLPSVNDSFNLYLDASRFAIGAELIQVQNGVDKVIAFSSFSLTPEQQIYCTTGRKLLAIMRFCLLSKIISVRTDHSSLTWLLRFKEPQG